MTTGRSAVSALRANKLDSSASVRSKFVQRELVLDEAQWYLVATTTWRKHELVACRSVEMQAETNVAVLVSTRKDGEPLGGKLVGTDRARSHAALQYLVDVLVLMVKGMNGPVTMATVQTQITDGHSQVGRRA